MPTVPETFAPGVSQGETPLVPAAGPWVSPMRNAAPSLLSETGATLARAGAVETQLGNTIGDRVQETFDDATTRNAETAFLSGANGVITRYTHSLGKDAIDGYDGAAQEIVKAKQVARESLANPVQQRMFDAMAMPRLVEFGKQLSDHHFQQNIQYGTQAANDRADSLVQISANSYSDWQRADGKYAANKMMAIHEAQQAALLLGQPPDSPQAKALVKQKTTALAQGVLTRMMDSEQYDEAQHYYDQALASGEIDERAAEMLGNAVKEGHNAQKGALLMNAARQSALGAPDTSQQRLQPVSIGAITETMGAPRADGRSHDGIDIAVPVGTDVQAPANGTVSKVWTDDKFGGGLSMEITYPNGNVEGFAHLSAVNYKPGQQVTQGAILAATGKSGNATGPVLHWAMKDKDGNWIDPRNSVGAPKAEDAFTTPEQLDKGVAYIEASDATDRVKDIAITKLRSQYGLAREMQSQKYQEVKQQAVDYYYQHRGIDGLPAEIRAQLRPEDVFRMSQPPATETDPETMANFILNPKSVTVASVKDAFADGKLSNGSYYGLLKDATDYGADPSKVMAATVQADRLKYFADQAGIPNIFKSQNEQQKRDYAALLVRVQTEIAQAQQQKQGKLSQNESDAIIQRNVQQHVITHLRSAWNPLSWIPGHNTYQQTVHGFQMPAGATETQRGSDGKLHYTDGTHDLGVVPE